MAAQLPVKGRAPKTGYARSQFGQPWFDADRNGCDTRNDILAAQLTDVQKSGRCKVMEAVLANDPYTGQRIVFIRGASKVDIDHVVALSDAWQKGAAAWPFAKRVAYANDPAVLLAVDSSCTGGVCNRRCVAGFANCDGTLDNGCESIDSTPNCGACGVRCDPSRSCTPVDGGFACR